MMLSDVCRVHPLGRRHVRPASCIAIARPGSRLPLHASIADLGGRPPTTCFRLLLSAFVLFSMTFVVFRVFSCSVSWLFWLGCRYQCKWLTGKTYLRNNLQHIDRDVKPYSLTWPLSWIIFQEETSVVIGYRKVTSERWCHRWSAFRRTKVRRVWKTLNRKISSRWSNRIGTCWHLHWKEI